MFALLWALAIVALMGTFLLLLPCGTVNAAAGCTPQNVFLPLPAGITQSITTSFGFVHWSLYVFGTQIGDAEVVCIVLFLSAAIVTITWKALRNLDIPVLNKWLH